MPEGQRRVLVADDDRVTRRIVSVKLSGLGYSVEEAADGEEALQKLLGGEVPDLLIVDHLMPRANGMQVVREVRGSTSPALRSLPVIMLTARQEERDVIEGLRTGVDDYVIKPFSPDELAARVSAVLRRVHRSV